LVSGERGIGSKRVMGEKMGGKSKRDRKLRTERGMRE